MYVSMYACMYACALECIYTYTYTYDVFVLGFFLLCLYEERKECLALSVSVCEGMYTVFMYVNVYGHMQYLNTHNTHTLAHFTYAIMY